MRTKNYLKENYGTVGLWILLFFIFLLQVIPQTDSLLEAFLFSILLIGISFPFSTYLSGKLLQKAIRKKKAALFTMQFLFFSAIIGLFFVILLFLFAHLEYIGIFPKSGYFDMNVPVYMLLVPISAGVVINISMCGIRFFQENTKLKKTLIEYQLRTLQHQVTPHFMFNVLNHIHILMQTDVELASGLLIKYSEILRYQLYKGEKQQVTLEEDIQFLKDFIAIEEMRWEGKLKVTQNWEAEDWQREIPALLFITFVENAFKYVSKSDFEKGYIDIHFQQKGSVIYFKIENSKSLLQKKKNKAGGLGLQNIRQRLNILYYGRHDLIIKETDSEYHVELSLNLSK